MRLRLLVPFLILVLASPRAVGAEWEILLIREGIDQERNTDVRYDEARLRTWVHPVGRALMGGCGAALAAYWIVPILGLACGPDGNAWQQGLRRWVCGTCCGGVPVSMGMGVLMGTIHGYSKRWSVESGGESLAPLRHSAEMSTLEEFLTDNSEGKPFLFQDALKRWQVGRFFRPALATTAGDADRFYAAVLVHDGHNRQPPLPVLMIVPFDSLLSLSGNRPIAQEPFEAQFPPKIVAPPNATPHAFTAAPPSGVPPFPRGSIPVAELKADELVASGIVRAPGDDVAYVAALEDLHSWISGEMPSFIVYRIPRARLRTLADDDFRSARAQRKALHPRVREATKAWALPEIANPEAGTAADFRWWRRLELLNSLRLPPDSGGPLRQASLPPVPRTAFVEP